MSRLDNLPPDLKAVISLVLRQGKRHAEVAGMLGIQERAVHDRAHAALALLAPGQARALTASDRERLGEYLLGQQSPAAEAQTRSYLESDPAAREWAQALARELAPLAVLPSIPDPRHAAPRSPSSRVGGAVVLGALAALIVVVVLLVVGIGGGGGSSHAGTQPSATSTGTGHGATGTSQTSSGAAKGAPAGAGAGTSTTGGTQTTSIPSAANGGASGAGSQTSHGKALTLSSPDPASKAIGVAYVLTRKNERAFYLFAKGLPALPSGVFYAVWLDGASNAPAYPLGSLPSPAANGLVEGGGPLPSTAGSYSRILVTSETSHHPSRPGSTALGGTFSLG
jgi:hypothetical protein